jgi:hypothetical protein
MGGPSVVHHRRTVRAVTENACATWPVRSSVSSRLPRTGVLLMPSTMQAANTKVVGLETRSIGIKRQGELGDYRAVIRKRARGSQRTIGTFAVKGARLSTRCSMLCRSHSRFSAADGLETGPFFALFRIQLDLHFGNACGVGRTGSEPTLEGKSPDTLSRALALRST